LLGNSIISRNIVAKQMNSTFAAFFRSPNNIKQTATVLSFIILGSLFWFRVALIFSYVPEITGMDNNFVHTVIRLLTGLSPYPAPEGFPYAGNIYTPLYFNICHLLGIATGADPEYPIQVYQVCRTVALLCDILSVFLLFRILIRKIAIDKSFALLSVALYSCLICYLAYTFSRVDCLFLTFYISVFYLLTKKEQTFTYRQILLVSILSVCCVFSKQNGIILPFLVSTWLFFTNYKQKIIAFLFSYTICFTVFYLFYTQVMGYTHLVTFAVKGLNNQIDPSWFYINIFKPLANSIIILPLCAGLVITIGLLLNRKTNFTTALSVVYLIQLMFSTGAAFKWGSSLGYFYENLALSLILITEYRSLNNFTQNSQSRLYWFASPLLIIFFIHVLLQDYLFFINQRSQRITEYKQQEEVKYYLRSRLNGRYVLDLYNPNRDFFKNFLYKEIAVPHFDAIDCCLLPDKTFDYTRLKEDFINGNIKYIIFPKDAALPSIWNVSLAHYQKDTSIYNFDLYHFRPDVKKH
jgi:hypothetical protein